MRGLLLTMCVVGLGLGGCSGSRGEPGEDGMDGASGMDGADGTDGADGSQGPEGPLAAPPRIESVSPESGSWRNHVTITGENFADSGNQVTFDGTLATVVTESATQLVVQPDGIYVEYDQPGRIVDVTVIANQQTSNAHAWLALPSGTARKAASSIPTQVSDLTTDGTMVYMADHVNGILTVDPANAYATSKVRGLGSGLQKPDSIAYSAALGLLVIDDVSAAGDGSNQQLLSVDPADGTIQILIGAAAGLSDAVDLAVEPASGDIYIAADGADTSNPVWRVSATDGVESDWGSADLDSDITSIAVVDTTAIDTKVYVAGQGANAGLFEFAAGDAGGGSVNTLKNLDTAVSPTGLAPNSPDLFLVESDAISTVADLDQSQGTVTGYSTFGMTGADDAVANVGGTLYFAGLDSDDTNQVTFVATDADTLGVVTIPPARASLYSSYAIGGDVYLSSYWGCVAFDSHSIHRVTASGSMEVVSTSGSCNIASAATSAGLIVTSDADANTVSTVDPATGTVTEILNDTDGVVSPRAVLVGPGDAVYVAHRPGGDVMLGLTDVNGSSFDASWVDLSNSGLSSVATMGEVLGNTFVFSTFAGDTIYSLDPGTGSVEVFVEPSKLPGSLLGMTSTAEGTVVVSFFNDVLDGGGLFELLDTGTMWPLYGFASDEFSAPFGVAQLPSRDYFMADLVGSMDLVHVTP